MALGIGITLRNGFEIGGQAVIEKMANVVEMKNPCGSAFVSIQKTNPNLFNIVFLTLCFFKINLSFCTLLETKETKLK